MADETTTSGTPEPEGGDAQGTATAGTPGTDDRNAESVENEKRLHLEWKSKAERTNQLERENAELKARLDQSPADLGNDEPDADAIEKLEREVNAWVEKDDPVAKWSKLKIAKLEDRQEKYEQAVIFKDQIRDMPFEERQEVYDHFQANRHRLGDPKAARAEVREKKLTDENAKLREQLKKATVKNDPDVVRTVTRDVPASEHKVRKMTEAEFDREQEELRQSGRHRERMAQQAAYARDEIEFTG